ncbi:MAG TPA: hypothetical protein VM487_05730 [Phycisphaerae bacterium]|nr:hypothetical protein [Phycisphaerae bacterium]
MVKLLVAGIFLLWFVPFAYERITTPPGRAPDDFRDLIAEFYQPGENDATTEWLAALSALPVDPTFDEPPPAGRQWEFQRDGTAAPMLYDDPTDMLVGAWDPASRPTLRVWIRFIRSEQTSAALQRITALRERPWLWDISPLAAVGADIPPGVDYGHARRAAELLVGRSRYRREEHGDAVGAWEDLKTVLLMVRGPRRDMLIPALITTACEALALAELRHMAREVEFDEDVARDIQETLQSLPSPENAWTEAMRGEIADTLHLASALYSDGGRGNGWLVLSEQPDAEAYMSGAGGSLAPADRSRLWNLLSPLYNDRRTVQDRVKAYWTERAHVVGLDYGDAVRRLSALDQQPQFGPTDGPCLDALGRFLWGVTRAYQLLVRLESTRHATRLMVALNCYKAERGRFPAALDELVPQFIAALPTDPYCAESFGYRLDAASGYILYARGLDGDDDGGRATRDSEGRPRAMGDEGDDIYTFPRDAPDMPEPKAVPLAKPDASTQQPDGMVP